METFAVIIEKKLYEKVKSLTENQLRKKDRPVSFIYVSIKSTDRVIAQRNATND
jgi:hypothetical protein